MARTFTEAGVAPGARRERSAGLGGRNERQVRLALRVMLLAILLILATVVTFTVLPRYQEQGVPVADNLDFSEGFRGWSTSGIITLDETELGHAILQNRDPEAIVHLYRQIELPPGRTHLLVAADVATSQVRAGEEQWHRARIFFAQQAPDGTYLWHLPHDVAQLIGTSARHNVRQIFEISPRVRNALLGIELAHATGMFDVANLRIEALEELPSFRLAATLVVTGWCWLGAWVGFRVLHSIRAPKIRLLLLLTAGLTLFGVFMPGTLRQELQNALAAGLGLYGLDLDAAGHAVFFCALAFLVRWARRRDPLVLHFTSWLLIGIAIEVLQLFTADRETSPLDWVADGLGAAVGLILAESALKLERLLQSPKKKPGPAPDPR
ncbi:MAG TPA: VanZ family protein [Geminicoccaceae bacterium]